MSEKIKVIVKRVGEDPVVEEVENRLGALQDLVGGYLESVTIATDMCALVDEEGLLKMHPVLNCGIRYGARAQYFVGDILAVGLGDEDFDDLPEEITIEEWEKMLVTGKKLMRLIYLPYYDDEDEDEEDEEDEQID